MATADNISEEEILPSTVKVYIGFLLSSIFIIGTVGNIIGIFSITFYKRLHDHVINILLANVALCSLIIDVFCAPILGVYLLKDWPQWPFNKTICNVSTYITETNTSVIVLTFFIMAVERYYATIKRKIIPKKVIFMCLAVIWLVSGCAHSTHVFHAVEVRQVDGNNETICNQLGGNITNEQQDKSLIAIVITNLAVMIITFVPLFMTGNHLRRLKKMKMPSSSKSFKVLYTEFKVVFIVISLSFGFFLPNWCVSLMQTTISVKIKVVILAKILLFMCTIITPLATVMFSKYFRITIIDMFMGCKNSTLRKKQKAGKDAIREPLTTQLALKYREYEEISTPPKFVKGIFKSSSKNDDMGNISIDSNEISPMGNLAKNNASYSGSDNESSLLDTNF